MLGEFRDFLTEAAKNFEQDTEREWQLRAELSRHALFEHTIALGALFDRGDTSFIDKLRQLVLSNEPDGEPSVSIEADLNSMFPARLDIAREILSDDYEPPTDLILLQHHLECVNTFFQFGPLFVSKEILQNLFSRFDYAFLRLLGVAALTFSELLRYGKDTARIEASIKAKRSNALAKEQETIRTYKRLTKAKVINQEDGPFTIARKIHENVNIEMSLDSVRRYLKKRKIC